MFVFVVAALALLTLVAPSPAQEQDLFQEAGGSLKRSEWIRLRQAPVVQVSLRSDDTIIIRSVVHAANAFAIKIDGKALATECERTEQKTDTSGWNADTFAATCELPEGTTLRIQAAHSVVIQASMLKKNTKALTLTGRKLENFRRLVR